MKAAGSGLGLSCREADPDAPGPAIERLARVSGHMAELLMLASWLPARRDHPDVLGLERLALLLASFPHQDLLRAETASMKADVLRSLFQAVSSVKRDAELGRS